MRIPALLLCATLALPAVAAGDSITLPAARVDGGNCAIFGCGTHFQQIYSSSLFRSDFEITSLTFFNTTEESAEGFVEPAHYQFRLGTTATAWNEMTTDFAANATGPLVTVADFTIPDFDPSFRPRPGASRTIDLLAPFLYVPGAGSLILDVVKDTSEEAGDGPVYIDHNAHFDGVSVVNNFARGGVETDRFVSHGGGLVTRFNGQAAPQTPEPASIFLLATGLAIAGAKRLRRGP
jgi:hypothetical protein